MQPAYQEYRLQELDQRRIEALWSFRSSQRVHHKVLPDGRIDILVRFRLNDDGTVWNLRPIIAGPAQRFASVPADETTGFVGVRFRPGWGGVCLGIDPADIRDNTLLGADAVQILGDRAVPLLRATTVTQLKMCLVDIGRALTASAPSNAAHARAMAAIELLSLSEGRKSVSDLADYAGTSIRTLHRNVTAALGLSVKSFASILRFQRAVRLMRMLPAVSLAELALLGGYSDQAHMTREFRELGGFTPGKRPELTVINLPA